MFFAVLSCLSLTSLITECYTASTEESSNQYECGAHGRFEYCIDGIPGCVIGCHCHPGYYFDTDTKICEPNTKLTQDFRRRYMPEPTRVFPMNTPTVTEMIPTPTTTNTLDERVDEIAKDTDDIGDWLFNQFFKTIETQVINKTNDDQTPTRRSANDVYRPANIPKRGGGRSRGNRDFESIKSKTRKSWRGKGKKKKSDVHGLRRKLLRITEDDSLFDSDSDDDEDSRGGSSDSSSSGSSSSGEGSGERKKDPNNKNDREHGHKKVIIFNRRPRPPLPSFIFLPSMDTPYYPPIGLPPPPIVPMFPLVPIPPMAPFLPFPEKKNDSTTTTTAASKDTGSTDTETTTVTGETTVTESADPSASPDATEEPKHSDRRTRPKSHRFRIPPPLQAKMSSEETFLIRARDPPPKMPNPASKHADRMKLMHKLRQRLKKKNKQPPIQENIVDDPAEDAPLIDETRKQTRHRPHADDDEVFNDVNFKYITELIHRVNLSDAGAPPAPAPAPINAKADVKQKVPNTRRNYDTPVPNIVYQDEPIRQNNVQKPEDVYFSNLGRQIASLVRNAESKMDNNIINDRNNRLNAPNIASQDSSYEPRSFWERSIRSPLTRFKNYFGKLNFDKESEEKNLFSLEDEVKTLATTTPPLTLQEIENILSTLQKAQAEMKKSKKSIEPSNDSFNVNLLPNKSIKTENSYRKFSNALDYTEYFPRSKHLPNTTNVSQYFTAPNSTHYLDPSNLDSPMIDDWMFDSQNYKQTMNSNQQTINQQIPNQQAVTNTSIEYESLKYNPKPPIPFYKKINKQKEYLKHHKAKPFASHNGALNIEMTPKYPDIPVNYPELHAKYPDIPVNYPELHAKYPDIPVNYPELHAKYPDIPVNYAELRAKYPEQPVQYPEQLVKVAEQPANYPDWSAKFAELSAKYPEISAKYRELLAKYPELPTKYPELLAKIHEPSTKSPPLSKMYPDVPVKYPMQPAKYQSNPTIVNYKSLDYFSDAENKRHYTFEASYPLRVPNYRRSFSKRFEPDSERPSYFHHELHHFDYLD